MPFWSIFEFYNIFTTSWYYVNYVWYVHLVNFTTIMPAVLETFSLFTVLELGKRFDKKGQSEEKQIPNNRLISTNTIKLLAVVGAFATLIPILVPTIGFAFIWIGLFLLIEPINYLMGRTSLIKKFISGKTSTIPRLFLAGITMGFFWELWNYLAYPKWFYTIHYLMSSIKLFEMPLNWLYRLFWVCIGGFCVLCLFQILPYLRKAMT